MLKKANHFSETFSADAQVMLAAIPRRHKGVDIFLKKHSNTHVTVQKSRNSITGSTNNRAWKKGLKVRFHKKFY